MGIMGGSSLLITLFILAMFSLQNFVELSLAPVSLQILTRIATPNVAGRHSSQLVETVGVDNAAKRRLNGNIDMNAVDMALHPSNLSAADRPAINDHAGPDS